MAEAYFVIKVFIVSCVLVFLMQYKVNGQNSAEQQILGFIHNSPASKWMTDAGTGAVRLTASVTNKFVDTQKLANTFKSEPSETPQQRMQKQLDQAKKQEEEWVKRVEQAVDGGYPAD